jgi:Ca2+-binding RTX toxin-like protein
MAAINGTNANNNLNGTNLADQIFGLAGNDILIGFDGDDVLEGGKGADQLFGSSGLDIASYRSSGAGVHVYLAIPQASGGDATGDSLFSIEGVIGSAFADELVGDSQRNVLRGESGADTLSGLEGDDTLDGGGGNDLFSGGAGDDELRGGAGIDTADFFGDTGVVADLASGTASGSETGNDRLLGIEHLRGSNQGDQLAGNGGANTLSSHRAADTLIGRGGADRFDFDYWQDSSRGAPDRILDFSRAQGDRIDLRDIDANEQADGNQAFRFVGQAEFTAPGQLRFYQANGEIVGELLAEACDLRWDERVLDVAAGNGNATLAAARRGCRVTSTDYVPALLDQAAERARAERLVVTFQEADAEALPFPDASFDAVLSTFGVMFAPDQPRAAAELARVCRPGGRIGLASWTPDGLIGRLFKVLGRHLPPPAGVLPPSLWGVEAHLHSLFGDRASAIALTPRTFNFRYRTAAHFVQVFRTWYGPVHKAFAALPAERAVDLEHDLVGLLNGTNRAGPDSLVVPSEYLEVVVTRR